MTTIPLSLLSAGKHKHVVPPDLRNLVTAVDPASHSITITSMQRKRDTVLVMADPNSYPNEVIINGTPKTFGDIVKGLQYMTSVEVKPNVIESISLRDADPAPR
jgi:hypothetical protein